MAKRCNFYLVSTLTNKCWFRVQIRDFSLTKHHLNVINHAVIIVEMGVWFEEHYIEVYSKATLQHFQIGHNMSWQQNAFSTLVLLKRNERNMSLSLYLFADIVAGHADEVENDIHIPRVIDRVLLRQYRHFQHLVKKERKHKTNIRERFAMWCSKFKSWMLLF